MLSVSTIFTRRGVLLLAAGALIGYGVGRFPGPQAAGAVSGGAGPGLAAGGSGPGTEGRGAPGAAAGGRGDRRQGKELGDTVRSIFRETIKERRVAMFEGMLERAEVEDFGTLVSLIRENDLRGNDTGEEWTRLWQAWGRRDPDGAFRFMGEMDWTGWDPAALGEARNRALISWAQTDLERARSHVEADEALAAGDRSMVYPLVRGWAEVDPEGAVAWLAKTGLARGKEYETVVEAISRRDGAEGLGAWFAELAREGAGEQDRNGFALAITRLKQEYEPEKAAAWVEQHLGEPWLPDSEIVESTAQALAARNPEEAMAWAVKTGIGRAAEAAMGTWCQQDLDGASAWMAAHADDPGHGEALQVVATYLMVRNATSAREWAERLPDSEAKERLLEEIVPGDSWGTIGEEE